MAKPASIKIRLNSSADTGFFYVTKKNARTMTEKMVVKKYDPVVRKHVEFRKARSSRASPALSRASSARSQGRAFLIPGALAPAMTDKSYELPAFRSWRMRRAKALCAHGPDGRPDQRRLVAQGPDGGRAAVRLDEGFLTPEHPSSPARSSRNSVTYGLRLVVVGDIGEASARSGALRDFVYESEPWPPCVVHSRPRRTEGEAGAQLSANALSRLGDHLVAARGLGLVDRLVGALEQGLGACRPRRRWRPRRSRWSRSAAPCRRPRGTASRRRAADALGDALGRRPAGCRA